MAACRRALRQVCAAGGGAAVRAVGRRQSAGALVRAGAGAPRRHAAALAQARAHHAAAGEFIEPPQSGVPA